MTKILTKLQLFVEKQQYTDKFIRNTMKTAIKDACGSLKKKIKSAKTVDEVRSFTIEIVKEIDNLKKFLKGNIVLSINENVNEAIDIASFLNNLKTEIKELVHKKTSTLDKIKQEAVKEISKMEDDMINFIQKMDLNIEKTNARMAKSSGKAYEPKFLLD